MKARITLVSLMLFCSSAFPKDLNHECAVLGRTNSRVDAFVAGQWSRNMRGDGWSGIVKGQFRVLYHQPWQCKNKTCAWTYKNRLFVEAWEFQPVDSPTEFQSVFIRCKEILDEKVKSAQGVSDFSIEDNGDSLALKMTLHFVNGDPAPYRLVIKSDFMNYFY